MVKKVVGKWKMLIQGHRKLQLFKSFCRSRTLDLWAPTAPKNGPMNRAAHSSTGGGFSSTAFWKSHLRMDFSERLSFSPATAVPSRNCLGGGRREGEREGSEGRRGEVRGGEGRPQIKHSAWGKKTESQPRRRYLVTGAEQQLCGDVAAGLLPR